MSIPNPRNIELIKDDETREQIKSLQEEALGNIISLSTTPTAAAPQIEANELGDDGTDLWIRVGNTLLQITPTSRITIT